MISSSTPALRDLERPFFIVGTERSGSNLLRLVLDAHSRLSIPHPPHIMRFVHPLAPSYGDLADDRVFAELAADVSRLVAWHTYPWPHAPGAAELVARSRGRTLFALYAAACESHCVQAGKARWGCKSTFMIHHGDVILRQYPAARFLLLVRDPRDVAVSARESVFNHFHPWFVARLWAHEQRKGRRLLETLAPSQTLRLHYEALLADPEGEVRRVCAFLDEPFEPSMLAFFERPEARRSASLCHDWRNTDRGILRGNAGRFARALAPRDIAWVEAAAAAEMAWFGYEPVHPGPVPHPGLLEQLRFWVEEKRAKARVEWRSLRRDRNYPLRVRKDLLLLWLRLKSAWRNLRARLSGR